MVRKKSDKKASEGLNSPLANFFSFKNSETYEEISKVISACEGIRVEELGRYLGMVHAKAHNNLYNEADMFIRAYWRKNDGISFHELDGIFRAVLNEMAHNIIHRQQEYLKEYKKKVKKDSKV